MAGRNPDINPAQELAGRYLLRAEGQQPYNPAKERHAPVTAGEALQAIEKTQGRVVVAVFGIHSDFSRGGDNLQWRNGVIPKSQRDAFIDDIKKVQQDTADYKADLQAKFRASYKLKPDERFNRSQAQTIAAWTRQYEQQRMVELFNSNRSFAKFGYSRIQAMSFAEAPLKRKR